MRHHKDETEQYIKLVEAFQETREEDRPPHTPRWLARRGLKVTPLGEFVFTTLGAVLIVAAFIALMIFFTGAFGPGGR